MRFAFGMAVLLLAFPHMVSACECRYEPPCARIHKSATIFSGRVLDAGPGGAGPFRFQIDEVFKGLDDGAREVEVQPGLCVAAYKPGQRYLVLAGRSPNGLLFSGDCTGTVSLGGAEENVRIIRAWAHGMPVQQLQGTVAENTEDSLVRFEVEVENSPGLAGVEVTAVKDGKTFTANTDSHGTFRISVPEPGHYEVRAVYPGHSSTKSEYQFTVEAGACAEHDIGMWTDSKVTGIVFDAARRAVAGLPVEMVLSSTESTFEPLTAVTDAKGAFQFAKVPKGEYLLGVNVHGLTSKLPYEPRFYPGVARRELALPVRIAGPETLQNVNMEIGNRLPTRPISVSVVWPDGKPVSNASVMCESSRSDDRRFIRDWVSRYTNAQGEAVCEVLTDRDFEVHIDRLNWSASSRPVQPIASRPRQFVAAGAAPVFVRISVDPVNDISDKERPSDMSRFNGREQ